jgi:hypothetical protein
MGRSDEDRETCGRCAMSSVSGVMDDDHDPFEGDRIEVDESEVRKVSPSVVLGRVKRRIDRLATKITYGR